MRELIAQAEALGDTATAARLATDLQVHESAFRRHLREWEVHTALNSLVCLYPEARCPLDVILLAGLDISEWPPTPWPAGLGDMSDEAYAKLEGAVTRLVVERMLRTV